MHVQRDRGRTRPRWPGLTPRHPDARLSPRASAQWLAVAHFTRVVSEDDTDDGLRAEVLGKETSSHRAVHVLTLSVVLVL